MKFSFSIQYVSCLLLGSFLVVAPVHAQQKEVKQQAQFWTSINSTFHITDKWGVMADFHIRRTNFLSDPNFYFARIGANYWVKEKFTLAAGYAHLWLAPSTQGFKRYANENRIFQQALMSTQIGSTGLLLRFRNEQRWQQILLNDDFTGRWKFTNRVRYLMSFSFPVSKQPGKLAVLHGLQGSFWQGGYILQKTTQGQKSGAI